MQAKDLARVLTCFADSPADVDVKKGTVVLQLRDELIEAKLVRKEGAIYIDEGTDLVPASSWVVHRIARLSLLAERILTYISEPPNFVPPSATVLDQPELGQSQDETACANALQCLSQMAGRRPVGTASVLYLTSDAGEGKTTLINALARRQADLFKSKKSDWLLVPVALGGRAFLRFDELVVSALVNRFRFQLLYYEGFLELVRLGVVVPAFDGFEEMFVEGSSGEAISALGGLLNQLCSEGSVVVAARKAYFEYQSFRTQAKLFDAIGDQSVGFSRLALQRWNKDHFVAYANRRAISTPEKVYEVVSRRLGAEHPLLTRAVLVRRLLDIAASGDISELAVQLGTKPQDYFHQFVQAIIAREVGEKWLDKEGKEGQSLLSIDEHVDLLAAIAQEMWIACSDALPLDVIDAVTDIFCEQLQKSPVFTRQIRERIKTHALLVGSMGSRAGVSFDHDDFRHFFVGVGLGRLLKLKSVEDVRSFLRIATCAPDTMDEAVNEYKRSGRDVPQLVEFLLQLAGTELPTSFLRENVGGIVIRLLDGLSQNLVISGLTFPPESLVGRTFSAVTFRDCYFLPTAIEHSTFDQTSFQKCKLERLELSGASLAGLNLYANCEVGCVVTHGVDSQAIYHPELIWKMLISDGAQRISDKPLDIVEVPVPDEELVLLERILRTFARQTHISESLIKTKLGARGAFFSDDVVPKLVKAGVFEEVTHHGSGVQKRFKLADAMANIQSTLTECGGRFDEFLRKISHQ
jgi:hypothetical protein